jgi:predicted permease
VDSLSQDARFGLRSLAHRPLFTTVAVVTLALGIGGTTAVFSVVDGVLIKDLPYRDPSSLVSVWRAWPSWRGVGVLDYVWDHIQFAAADFVNIRDRARTLDGVAASVHRRVTFAADERTEEIWAGFASANLFELLGVQPILGRTFHEDEALPAATSGARVALLSAELWRGRFAGDPGILGRAIVMGGEVYEVIGVLPPGFRLASDLVAINDNAGSADRGFRDVWAPLGRDAANCGNCLELLARLAPSRSIEEARAEVQTLLLDHPGDPPGQVARVVSRKELLTRGFGAPLLILFAAAGLLLLIACLNVAGLLVGEAAGRQQELAVRAALGAGRGRIVRQLLTESALLGLTGAVAGAVVAWLGVEALLRFAPPMPRAEAIGLDGRVLAFAVGTGLATGIFFGLAPALGLGRVRPAVSLTRVAARGGGAPWLQRALVSLQVGLTVVLLIAGGLLGRSLTRLMSVDPGFAPEGLATLSFAVPAARDGSAEAMAQFQAEVVRVASAVPGAKVVSATNQLPFPGGRFSNAFGFRRDGAPVTSTFWNRSVLPNYHETLGIPLLQGRLLCEADGPGAPDVIVVSRSLAQRNWPGESPLGKRVWQGGSEGRQWTVVGVVGDVRHKTLAAPAEPTLYRTTAQSPSRRLYLVARTVGDPAATIRALQAAIWALDSDTPIADAATMTALIRDSERDDRFRAVLMWVFAGVGALLASVGIFGVTARTVSGRAREMAIRMALGAPANGLVGLVLEDGLVSATVGTGLGLIGATWTAGLIRHFLYEIDARDPVTYAGAVALAFTMCLVAAYLPARRITRIEPAALFADE